jgi:hypothetical protein
LLEHVETIVPQRVTALPSHKIESNDTEYCCQKTEGKKGTTSEVRQWPLQI